MRWNWYTQFHRLDSHFNQFFPTCRFEKMRTLLAGYTFIGFALLYFPAVTSCPFRGLFLICWETKQLSCFPFKFALFLFFFFYFLSTEVATCSPRLPIFCRSVALTLWFCSLYERSTIILVEMFSDMCCLEDNISRNCQTETQWLDPFKRECIAIAGCEKKTR